MRVKITQPGWHLYDGDLGTVPFKGGVSVGHIPEREAYSLGAYVTVVEIDEDGNELGPVSPAFDQLKLKDVSAEIEPPLMTLAEHQANQKAAEAKSDEPKVVEDTGPKVWTKEALEAVATEKGIAGIREITDPLDVRGTSIRGLIAEIMARNPKAI